METVAYIIIGLAFFATSFFFFHRAETLRKRLVSGGHNDDDRPLSSYVLQVRSHISTAPRWMQVYLRVLPTIVLVCTAVALAMACYSIYVMWVEYQNNGLQIGVITSSAPWVVLSMAYMFVAPSISKMIFNIPFQRWLKNRQ